jgi:nitrogen regulatory protein PII
MSKLNLITCVVQKGFSDAVFEEAMKAGAEAATITNARGTGIRQKLGELGQYIQEEKEVIRIIVKKNQKDSVFNALVQAGNLNSPGRGIAYIQPIDKVAGFIEIPSE